jgi:hypothetical protein
MTIILDNVLEIIISGTFWKLYLLLSSDVRKEMSLLTWSPLKELVSVTGPTGPSD